MPFSSTISLGLKSCKLWVVCIWAFRCGGFFGIFCSFIDILPKLLFDVLNIEFELSSWCFGFFLNEPYSLSIILLISPADKLSISLLCSEPVSCLCSADFWDGGIKGENLLLGPTIGLSLMSGAPRCLAMICCFIILIYSYFFISASFTDFMTNWLRLLGFWIGLSRCPVFGFIWFLG